jgi:glycosyltransferase involved in cell wall biosynthesis
VTSNSTSLPEVVGGNAVLVDPEDVGSIADGIVQILANTTLRQRLAEGGRKRAASFTWDAAAQQTLQLLLQQTRN